LAAWGIRADGRKGLLHLALGNKESYPNWLDFLRDLVKRGLQAPVMITTDDAPVLIWAVEEVFPRSLRQRCLALKMRNVLASRKVHDQDHAAVKAMVQAAYYAPTQEVAGLVAADALKQYQARFPAAMKSFQDDWEACIAYLRCPQVHHPCLPQGKCKRIRTTNLLERSFLEERRRTEVIPRFFTERSCLKLANQSALARSEDERTRASTTQAPETRVRFVAGWHTRRCQPQCTPACRRTHAALLREILDLTLSD